jgi:hypothetical protein
MKLKKKHKKEKERKNYEVRNNEFSSSKNLIFNQFNFKR